MFEIQLTSHYEGEIRFDGGTFILPVYHWFAQGWSVCGRWRASRATGPFLPMLAEGAHECPECEKAA